MSAKKEEANEYINVAADIDLSVECRKLKAENEHFRQEIHHFRRKFELNEAMLRELQETNESLERSLNVQISEKKKSLLDVEDKHRSAREKYEAHVQHLETTLAKKSSECETLKESLKNREEIPSKEVALISEQEDLVPLEERIAQLNNLLQEEIGRRETAEGAIEEYKSNMTELQDILLITKERLAEISQALESARDELVTLRAETLLPKIDPTTTDLVKGNSLFAEVEDRRLNALEKMNALRDKYIEAKRAAKAMSAEIKALRTERSTILSKWENDAIGKLSEDNDIIDKFKKRIQELEAKLKFEIKKNTEANQVPSADASYSYLQKLISDKKKDVDMLRLKVEDLSTHILVQEDAKFNLSKQLRYWRFKAATLQAQVLAMHGDSVSQCGDAPIEQSFKLVETDNDQTPADFLPPMVVDASFEAIADTVPNEEKGMKQRTNHTESDVDYEMQSSKKILQFSEDTKTVAHGGICTKVKKREYPIVYISADPTH